MTRSISKFTVSLLIALCIGITVNAQYDQPSRDLPNFYKVNANLYRGGQPTEAGLAKLKQKGIRTIIDLRSYDQLAKKEEGWSRSAGVKFISMPMSNWFKPKDMQIDKIIKLIDDLANQPVFVHCQRGADRTGTVVAVYRISREGWNADRANEEAEKFGFGWWQVWMKDYINDYYRNFKAIPLKPKEMSKAK